MCNLYSIRARRKALADYFRLTGNRISEFDPLASVFPGQMAPIVKHRSIQVHDDIAERGDG